jgi:hypothetical protein
MLVVFPDKSIYYNEYLPDNYHAKFRPNLDICKVILNNKIIDVYEFIKDIPNCYYKTDTHINFKGAYIVYTKFINKINEVFFLNVDIKELVIKQIDIELNHLNIGIGDLTWNTNLGNQTLVDKCDTYYYSDDIMQIYPNYTIVNDGYIKIYDYALNDKTISLIGFTFDWSIVSNNIIYKNNSNKKYRVLFFYDSFLLNTLPLYLEMFSEVFMIKSRYSSDIINKINPDFVFEFCVERFL